MSCRHDFHSLNQQQIVMGYDAPIRNDRWGDDMMTHVWVVTMLPCFYNQQHNADRVFRTLDSAKAWAEQRLRDYCWTYRPGTRWFDAPGNESNYTDGDGERWITIHLQEIVE